MKAEASNNSRLTKNTLALYVRMLMLMLISLYTSRITLDVLGNEDYGIYNVVGGIVVFFTFFNGTMATATQRFLSFDIAKGDIGNLSRTFSLTCWIHIALAVIIIVAAEIGGLWLLYNKMNLPSDRMDAAFWVFQCSILTTVISVTQVPYNASIIAHEKMGIYAYLSILDIIFKLLLVILLQWINADKLILYAMLTLCINMIMLTIYRTYCIKNFKECHISFVWDKDKFKRLCSFAGWNLSAQVADIGRTQGVNIILNIFCGPALNAARAIAVVVNGVVTQFVSNFMTALNPQVVKYYANGEKEAMFLLVRRGCKYSSFLLLFLMVPLLLETDFILNLWLKEPPAYASIFCKLIMISSMINTLSSTVFFATMASGEIRNYQICMSTLILTVPVLSYIGYELGLPPYSCLYPEILVCIISLFLRPYLTRMVTGFPISTYFTQSIFPVILVFVISFPIPLYLNTILEEGWMRLFAVCITNGICVLVAVLLLGMSHSERKMFLGFIRKKVLRTVP